MSWLKRIEKSLGEITEISLLLIAFGIVIEILFGNAVPFLGRVAANLTELLNTLGDKGPAGLIASGIIFFLFYRTMGSPTATGHKGQVKPTRRYSKSEDSVSRKIDTIVLSDIDRQKVDSLIQELIDYKEKFVSGLGNNLLNDLSQSNFEKLSEKVYAQLSRWCHPKRKSERERWAKEKAAQISVLLYGRVIDRIKHSSYTG